MRRQHDFPLFIRGAEASSTESLALIILLMSNGVPKASLTKALTLQLLTFFRQLKLLVHLCVGMFLSAKPWKWCKMIYLKKKHLQFSLRKVFEATYHMGLNMFMWLCPEVYDVPEPEWECTSRCWFLGLDWSLWLVVASRDQTAQFPWRQSQQGWKHHLSDSPRFLYFQVGCDRRQHRLRTVTWLECRNIRDVLLWCFGQKFTREISTSPRSCSFLSVSPGDLTEQDVQILGR